jgi:hypothetical protein
VNLSILPKDLRKIGTNAFAFAKNVWVNNFSSSVIDIGQGAFFNSEMGEHSNITEIYISNPNCTIGKQSFAGYGT